MNDEINQTNLIPDLFNIVLDYDPTKKWILDVKKGKIPPLDQGDFEYIFWELNESRDIEMISKLLKLYPEDADGFEARYSFYFMNYEQSGKDRELLKQLLRDYQSIPLFRPELVMGMTLDYPDEAKEFVHQS